MSGSDRAQGSPEPETIDALLGRVREGERSAVDQLLPIVYDELRDLVAGLREGSRKGGRAVLFAGTVEGPSKAPGTGRRAPVDPRTTSQAGSAEKTSAAVRSPAAAARADRCA